MKKILLVNLGIVLLFSTEFKTKTFIYDKFINHKTILLKILNNPNKIGLKYLNFLRNKAGEINLTENQYLDKAALNHAKYMTLNKIIGHYEYEGDEGFTGITPSDRVIAAGYKSRMVLENLSYGDSDINESIDGLFSAIYHRLGFLNEWINEIGIGVDEKAFVYDMGNSYLNKLCNESQKEVNGAYYTNICADNDLKLLVSDVDNAKAKVEKQNAKIVLWPVSDLSVSPVFYEEDPDPLPNQSVSGYPISVKFNEFYYKDVNFLDFKLFDKNNNEIDTILLYKDTDPNNKLSDLEFAIFPKNRLDWGSKYTAIFDYEVGGIKKEIKWSFYTKNLPYPYYKINSNEFNATVLPNKTYAFYFVPQNVNDKFNSVQIKYNVEDIDFDFIDKNTIKILLKGKIGEKAILMLGDKKLTLVIGDSESPKPILSKNSLKDQNISEIQSDYFSSILNNLTISWQLKGALEDINLSKYEKSKNKFLIWKYKDSKWCIFTSEESLLKIAKEKHIKICNDIQKGEGFWIKKY